MHTAHSPAKYSSFSIWCLRILVVALVAATFYGLEALKDTEQIYSDVDKTLSEQSTIAEKTELAGHALVIPTYEMFTSGNIWLLVSKDRPLKGEAGFELVDVPIEHGDSDQPMKVARNIVEPLKALAGAASDEGEELMISSAYRSLEEQQKIYDSYVDECGTACASQYVSPVGASEHHTGLSVDFSSASGQCSADSDDCSLGSSAAAWLAENAWKYGFIQRYPAGKQAITGVAQESWHFRYVGTIMAATMHDSGLTYDEVVQQLAPGYSGAK